MKQGLYCQYLQALLSLDPDHTPSCAGSRDNGLVIGTAGGGHALRMFANLRPTVPSGTGKDVYGEDAHCTVSVR